MTNSPEAIWWWLLLPTLCLLALYALGLAVGAVCGANIARHRDAALAQGRELPQSVLDDLADECLDPNIHYRSTGCQTCRDSLVRIRATVAAATGFDLGLWEHELGVQK